ncbi:MAG: EpsI family protein [Desulfovibrionaceae bacterium]|nr:EpsI family protein [Desulfovibrionaceae bacterium]MDD4952361.1 EpsI family protein [Desulfovibrionaceae bacterium]
MYLVVLVFAAAWVSFYAGSFGVPAAAWNAPGHVYCWFAAAAALCLAGQRKFVFGVGPHSSSPRSAYSLLFLSLALLFVGRLGQADLLVLLSMWLSLVSALLFYYGLAALRVFYLPLAVLALAVPLPEAWLGFLTRWPLRAALDLSGLMAGLAGASGPAAQALVVHGGPGLEYVLPSALMALVFGSLKALSPGRRTWLVLAAWPASVAVCALCLAAGAVVGLRFPALVPDPAGPIFRILTYVSCAAAMCLLAGVFRTAFTRRAEVIGGSRPAATRRVLVRAPVDARSVGHLVLASVFLLLGLAGQVKFLAQDLEPERRPFSELPMELNGWQGGSDPAWAADLEGDIDALRAQFRDPGGREVTLWAVYRSSQRPFAPSLDALPGRPDNGWRAVDSKVLVVAPGGARRVPATQIVLAKDSAMALANCWFQGRGRVFTSPFMGRVFMLLDAALRHRTDGAFVCLRTPLGPDRDQARAQALLDAFQARLDKVLPEFIPE